MQATLSAQNHPSAFITLNTRIEKQIKLCSTSFLLFFLLKHHEHKMKHSGSVPCSIYHYYGSSQCSESTFTAIHKIFSANVERNVFHHANTCWCHSIETVQNKNKDIKTIRFFHHFCGLNEPVFGNKCLKADSSGLRAK